MINKTKLLYLLVFSVLLYTVDDSFAVSDFSVQIPRDSYISNDTVYVTGTLYAPSGSTLTIKIYDGEAKVTWISRIPILSSDTEFSETIVLSGSKWSSGLYIILAEIDHEIVSTKFTFESIESDVILPPIPIDSEPTIEPIVVKPAINPAPIVKPIVTEPISIDTDLIAQQIIEKIVVPSPTVVEITNQEMLDTDLISKQITADIIQKINEDKSSNSNDLPLLLIIILLFVVVLMLLIILKMKSTKTQIPETTVPEIIEEVKEEIKPVEPIKEIINLEEPKVVKLKPIEFPKTKSRQSFELITLTNISSKKLKFTSSKKED